MKKKIFALLGAALMTAALAACGRELPVETAEPTAPAPVEAEVPYQPETEAKQYEGAQLRLLTPLWDTDPEAQVLLQAAEVFHGLTGAEVQIIWAADPASGVGGCDIVHVETGNLRDGLLVDALDLEQMAQAAGYDEKSFEALRNQVTQRCGYLAGIPMIPEVGGIYYVRDAFSAAGIGTVPGTWTEFLNTCQTLKNGGFEPLALNNQDAALAAYLHLERNLGADAVKTEEDKGKYAADEALVTAAQQLVDFVAGGNVLTAEYPGGQNKLALSNAAMTVGTNTLCAQVEEGTFTDLSWGMFPWPGEGGSSGSYIRSEVLSVSRGSEHPQAAFDFILLLCTGEFDQLRVDITGGIPADPANESAVSGAKEALLAAGSFDGTLPEGMDTEVFTKLWAGKYKTGEQFAKAWDKSR